MLPKAVLSFVGRLVGTAAVLASPLSPLVAEAAETSDASSTKTTTVARPVASPSRSSSHSHRHKSAEKKARKRGARHFEGSAEAQNQKPASSHCEDSEVTTERASAKTPLPRPSATPLPTLAAAATRPLVEPIATKSELVIEPKGHAVEPRRTPIVRALAHIEATGDAAPHAADGASRHEKHAKPPCLHAPVNFTRGSEEETFSLTKCDGSALPHAVDEMSILVRPGSAAKQEVAEAPTKAAKVAARDDAHDQLASGIKKIDERVVERLQLVIDRFAKPATTPKVFVVSGLRPSSKGSFHAMGRAIDFRVDGVENTDLVAFCKTLPDTGCGFYPNSSFVHLDVRDSGSGHVAWIDASSPGEKPEYVAAWPPPPNEDEAVKQLAKLDELQLLPVPEHGDAARVSDAKPVRARHAEQAQAEKAEPACAPEHVDHIEPASLMRRLEDE